MTRSMVLLSFLALTFCNPSPQDQEAAESVAVAVKARKVADAAEEKAMEALCNATTPDAAQSGNACIKAKNLDRGCNHHENVLACMLGFLHEVKSVAGDTEKARHACSWLNQKRMTTIVTKCQKAPDRTNSNECSVLRSYLAWKPLPETLYGCGFMAEFPAQTE